MQFSFGKFTIAAQPFHFSMGFAVSPVFLQLRKGERQSGYSCVCFMKYSQFTDTVLLHMPLLSATLLSGDHARHLRITFINTLYRRVRRVVAPYDICNIKHEKG